MKFTAKDAPPGHGLYVSGDYWVTHIKVGFDIDKCIAYRKAKNGRDVQIDCCEGRGALERAMDACREHAREEG